MAAVCSPPHSASLTALGSGTQHGLGLSHYVTSTFSTRAHTFHLPIAGATITKLTILVITPGVHGALCIDGNSMELTRADGSHTVQFGDESKTGAAAAAATAKLTIHAARDHEKGA